jgi:hypothetical protein
VRLALFQEQKRMPLRRDEISKKVIGSGSQHRGAFRPVFEEAQNILRATFGMELVELPTRAAAHDVPGGTGGGGATGKDKAREKAGTQNGEEAGDRQTVTGLKKKGAVPTVHPPFFFPFSFVPEWTFWLIVCICMYAHWLAI